ncbi:hypothetical protein VFPPC_13219 [Pochonia chlamydosporia 170]|uniref:Uncharacterized protein n=1 Tax=Pochonia chlamydosporia 170 TaxID=1380566 RepID=A0A179F6T4_METCM|nr:hypothetical protein VFPPC_13219 [Pochonia chlamydosporia 170]OAQ61176.1 hypothetical protein VFPPC_13219 [Pochonia chlamydosporia 170]
MSLSTVNNAPVNANATENEVPVNQIAGSTRCAKDGCNNWAEANSRFCSSHQG